MKKRLLAAALMLVSVTAAGAQDRLQPPNKVDLKAMYCLPVLQYHVQRLTALMKTDQVRRSPAVMTMSQDALRHFRRGLDRIHTYLSPRLPYLEPKALQAAKERGLADDALTSKQLSDCHAATGSPKEADACRLRQAAAARTRECMHTTFLPF